MIAQDAMTGVAWDPLLLLPGWQLILVSLTWVLHSVLLGHCALRAAACDTEERIPNSELKIFFASTLGMAVNILALQVLAFAGWFDRVGVLFWAGASFGVSLLYCRFAEHLTNGTRRDSMAMVAATAMVLLGMVTWGAAVAPGHWDDTMYHLPLAKTYVEHGGVVLASHLRFPLFPQNMNLVQGLGLMFGDVRLAQALSTLPLGLTILGLAGASRWLMGARFWGVFAGLLLWLASPVKLTWGYAYVDNGLALFCWAAALALALAKPTAHSIKWHRGWVTAAAVFAATAAGTKYFGAVFAFLLALLLLPSARRDRAMILYALVGTFLGVAWYVRSFWISGDPVHPAGGGVFGYFLWSASDLANQQAEQAQFGVTPWPWLIFEALDMAGMGWWSVAIVGLWGMWRPGGPIRVLQWIFFLYLSFWFAVTQVERYLAPIHGVASFLSVWTLIAAIRRFSERWPTGQLIGSYLARSRWDLVASVAISVVLVVNMGPKLWQKTKQYEIILSGRPGYALMQHANALIPEYGDQLTQIFFENARFYFRGTVHGDFFGPARYWPAIRCGAGGICAVAEPQALADFARSFNSRMVLIGTTRLTIDLPAYKALFEVARQTPDGVLLLLRKP